MTNKYVLSIISREKLEAKIGLQTEKETLRICKHELRKSKDTRNSFVNSNLKRLRKKCTNSEEVLKERINKLNFIDNVLKLYKESMVYIDKSIETIENVKKASEGLCQCGSDQYSHIREQIGERCHMCKPSNDPMIRDLLKSLIPYLIEGNAEKVLMDIFYPGLGKIVLESKKIEKYAQLYSEKAKKVNELLAILKTY